MESTFPGLASSRWIERRGGSNRLMPEDSGRLARMRAWVRRIKADAWTLWLAAGDPRTPWLAKALAAFVVAYALSPIDLIPDFIPVLGLLDDLLLLPLLIGLAVRLVPQEVLTDCRQRAQAQMLAGTAKPRSLIGAVVIVTLWVVAAAAGTWWWFRPAVP